MADSQLIIYQTEDGITKIETRLEDETVWLNLFQKSKSTVSEYLKNIFDEGQLKQNSVIRKFRTTATEVKNRKCGN